MSDLGEYYNSMRTERKKAAKQNRQSASDSLLDDMSFAANMGMSLTRLSDVHYELRVFLHPDQRRFWLYNLYPGNRRIYIDKKNAGAFLRVDKWSFMAIIEAADKARANHAKRGSNEH